MRIELAPLSQKESLRPYVRAYVRELHLLAGRYGPQAEYAPDTFELFAYDRYWRDPDRRPLMFQTAGALAGFALINRVSMTGQPLDWGMAEFCVLPDHRRQGLGSRAAAAIFLSHPGIWEVGVLEGNHPARVFWPKVISEVAGGFEEVWDEDGPIYRFTSAP